MKLTLETADSRFSVQSYERGRIMIDDSVIDYPVIIDAQGYRRWRIDGDRFRDAGDLTARDFAAALAHQPEIVLLGTGAAYRPLDARIMLEMRRNKVGFEAMDTPAACRTYNVLLAEGRKVAAAVLMI